MWGETLASLKASQLRVTPGLATLGRGAPHCPHPMLAAGAPSNQQILDATKAFYDTNQPLVDATTVNANGVASARKDYVAQLNGNNWQSKQLTQTEKDQTSAGLFGAPGGGGSLFGPTLDKVKASNLFSTIGVGVSAEAIVGIGGLGGLGCAWDIAKREGPKGYGYATLELGIKLAFDVNVQVTILNKLPSELNTPVYGLTVGIYYGLGATFTMFYTGMGTDLLGYGIAIGLGGGAGAAVFGGHIWNFG